MAQSSNTLDRYDVGTGAREELLNTIYNISPTEVPFTSNVGRGSSDQTYREWQIDDLAAATDNKHIDGDEFSADALTPPVRVGNYHQISRKDLVVSRRANIVRKAGRKSEVAYEIAKGAKELKRDVELAALKRKPAVPGSASTAMEAAGVPAWITTNDDLGAGGSPASPTLSSSTSGYPNKGGTVGTTAGKLTQARLDAVIRKCYEAGGNPNLIILPPELKQGLSNYLFTSSARVAVQYQDQKASPKMGATVLGAVDMYVSDFGVLSIVPNRFSPAGDASTAAKATEVFVLDTEYWELSYLDSYHTEVIAKIGDHERRMLIVDWTVCSKNEAASGVITAINQSTAVTAS